METKATRRILNVVATARRPKQITKTSTGIVREEIEDEDVMSQ